MKKPILLPLIIIFGLHIGIAQDHLISTDGYDEYFESVIDSKNVFLSDLEKFPESVLFTSEPGWFPEGDNVTDLSFSWDDELIVVSNAFTHNVSIIQTEGMFTLANIPVGQYPFDIAVTPDYFLVACLLSNEVYIISAATFEVQAIIPTDEQPVMIRVSHDHETAYVACDINDVCEVIDLKTLTHIDSFSNFHIGLYSFGGMTRAGRVRYRFTDFVVTKDDEYLVTTNSVNQIEFVNSTTGVHDHIISNVHNGRNIRVSDNNEHAVVTGYDPSSSSNVIYQVDMEDYTIKNSVFTYINQSAGMDLNYNGSKALVAGLNETKLVRFETSDVITFNQTNTPVWIENSCQYDQAIFGRNVIYIFDFQTESIINQHSTFNQRLGAVSRKSQKLACLFEADGETIGLYKFDSSVYIFGNGQISSGAFPEADAPYRVKIYDNGRKAVYTNCISANMGIINLSTNSLDTLIYVGYNTFGLELTKDFKYAVALASNNNKAIVIDLSNGEVVGSPSLSDNPMSIIMSPDGQHAFIGNLASDKISVLAVGGKDFYVVETIPIGNIGTIYAGKGIQSDMTFSNGGDYLLVAATFSNKVQVIDVETFEVLADIPTGTYPFQIDMLFGTNYAVVCNYFSNDYSLLYIDGSDSYHVATFASGGTQPTDIADNGFGNINVLNYGSENVTQIDPFTGTILSTTDYPQYGRPVRIDYNQDSERFILFENNYFLINETAYHFGGAASGFDYYWPERLIGISVPGPDKICVIDPLAYYVDLKVNLEGAFNGVDMSDDLSRSKHLPKSQPFNVSPWDYSGTEKVWETPDSNVVDWVLVELREYNFESGSSYKGIVEKQAGFLLKDGSIVSVNKTLPIKFRHGFGSDLYAIVWHRNHLGIMSNYPLTKMDDTYSYDFTIGPEQVFGGENGHKELLPGIWGMRAGDANGDGIIDQDDINSSWVYAAGESGYYSADLNQDGQIDNTDKNVYWLPNLGESSMVPD